VSKQVHTPTLLQLFRQYGYEGLTLSKISQSTGLGKASLYHHFPGGKMEMAQAALCEVDRWLDTTILPILLDAPASGQNSQVIDKFTLMCIETSRFFNEGQNSCLWAVLMLEQASDELFHSQISLALSRWIEAIVNLLVTAGLDKTPAQQRGEDAMVAIQGALIMTHGLRDLAIFDRVLTQIPQQLCQGICNR
jgi:TetR/AcrR family transcriptional regulator, lmrAB and yxaGH operons repressor